MFKRIRDLFSYAPQSVGFGIRSDATLSVLTGSAQLPTPSQVVNPNETDGAIKGKIAPLKAGADRDDLNLPLEQGGYAVASTDNKTILKMVVISKESAQFDPQTVLDSSFGMAMSDEVRHRLAATWHIVQLGFESHDPMVLPALDLQWRIANRLAALTHGLVGDPIAQQYNLPQDHPAEGLDSSRHIAVTEIASAGAVRSAGMAKFDLPEMQISGAEPGDTLLVLALRKAIDHVLSDGPLRVGSSLAEWNMMTSNDGTIELIPVQGKSQNECCAAWLRTP